MKPETAGTLRHLLTALGGALVAKGYFDAAGLEQLINIIEVVAGGIVSLVGLVWSIRAKRAASAEAAVIAMRVVADDTKKAGMAAPI